MSDHIEVSDKETIMKEVRQTMMWAPISFAIEAFCFMQLWDWFAVPRGMPEVGYGAALVIGLAATVFRGSFNPTNMFAPICLAAGFVVHAFGWL